MKLRREKLLIFHPDSDEMNLAAMVLELSFHVHFLTGGDNDNGPVLISESKWIGLHLAYFHLHISVHPIQIFILCSYFDNRPGINLIISPRTYSKMFRAAFVIFSSIYFFGYLDLFIRVHFFTG
jgi:hypothetical protein